VYFGDLLDLRPCERLCDRRSLKRDLKLEDTESEYREWRLVGDGDRLESEDTCLLSLRYSCRLRRCLSLLSRLSAFAMIRRASSMLTWIRWATSVTSLVRWATSVTSLVRWATSGTTLARRATSVSLLVRWLMSVRPSVWWLQPFLVVMRLLVMRLMSSTHMARRDLWFFLFTRTTCGIVWFSVVFFVWFGVV